MKNGCDLNHIITPRLCSFNWGRKNLNEKKETIFYLEKKVPSFNFYLKASFAQFINIYVEMKHIYNNTLKLNVSNEVITCGLHGWTLCKKRSHYTETGIIQQQRRSCAARLLQSGRPQTKDSPLLPSTHKLQPLTAAGIIHQLKSHRPPCRFCWLLLDLSCFTSE